MEESPIEEIFCEAKYNAAFDRCVDVMSRMFQNMDIRFWINWNRMLRREHSRKVIKRSL